MAFIVIISVETYKWKSRKLIRNSGQQRSWMVPGEKRSLKQFWHQSSGEARNVSLGLSATEKKCVLLKLLCPDSEQFTLCWDSLRSQKYKNVKIKIVSEKEIKHLYIYIYWQNTGRRSSDGGRASRRCSQRFCRSRMLRYCSCACTGEIMEKGGVGEKRPAFHANANSA